MEAISGVDRVKRALLWVLVWTIIVFIYSFRIDARGQPVSGWLDGFKIAAAQYYVWAALAPLVFWIDRRLPVPRDRFVRRLVFHVPPFVVFAVVYTWANYYTAMAIDAPYDMSVIAGGFSSVALRAVLRSNVWMYWVLMSLFLAFEYHKHTRERDLQTAQLERVLAQTQLAALRSQLHPHFLFNALNTVSALVADNPAGARLMLEQIGSLLRLSLEHASHEEVTLAKELTFIELYLQIQRARYEERLNVVVHLEPDVADMLVPTFLLQPLVENAVHHGVAPSFDNTLIEVSAARVDDRLCLRVTDNGFGLPDDWDLLRDAGIGLSNTRERLRRLYGDNQHHFDITRRAMGGVEVAVNVPLRMAS